MKLHEINQQQILDWLNTYALGESRYPGSFDIAADGTVNVTSSRIEVDLKKQLTSLKVKFGHVKGDFTLYNPYLESFEGLPTEVDDLFAIYDITGTKNRPGFYNADLRFLPKKMYGLYVETFTMSSWAGVHKHVSYLEEFRINESCRDSVLGFLLIPGFKKMTFFGSQNHHLHEVVRIVNEAGTGKKGVIAAQQALMDAGLDSYARL